MKELDKRLVGKSVSSITIAFVKANATEEEIDSAKYQLEDITSRKCLYILDFEQYLDTDKDIISKLESHLDRITQASREGHTLDWEGDEISIYLTSRHEQWQYGPKALQLLWKDQIKGDVLDKAERDEYNRLKAKFEDEDA